MSWSVPLANTVCMFGRDTLIRSAVTDVDRPGRHDDPLGALRNICRSRLRSHTPRREGETQSQAGPPHPTEDDSRRQEDATDCADARRLQPAIDAVAHDGERDSVFCASRSSSMIPSSIGSPSANPMRVSRSAWISSIWREAFLACDFAMHPSLLPVPPGRQGECLEDGVRGIDLRNGAIKITEDLGVRHTTAQIYVVALSNLIV